MSGHASPVGRNMPAAGAVAAASSGRGSARDSQPCPDGDSPPKPPSGHDPIVSRHWPFQCDIELSPVPAAVPRARVHTRHVLRDWGLTRLSADAELLVCELTTNAIAATRTARRASLVRLWLLADEALALVLVWDPSPLAPVPAEYDPGAEGGRGLHLVQAISRKWAWYRPRDRAGKVVWALAAGARPESC